MVKIVSFELFQSAHAFLGCHYPPQYECKVCHERFPFVAGVRNHLKSSHQIDAWEQFYERDQVNMDADLSMLDATIEDLKRKSDKTFT